MNFSFRQAIKAQVAVVVSVAAYDSKRSGCSFCTSGALQAVQVSVSNKADCRQTWNGFAGMRRAVAPSSPSTLLEAELLISLLLPFLSGAGMEIG